MNLFELVLIVLSMTGVLPENSSRSETFCEEYVSQFDAVSSTQEQRAVLGICRAELPGFEGPVLAMGEALILLPKEFYVIADQTQFLLALTSVDANLGREDWPYTTAGISIGSPFDSIESERVSIEPLPMPSLAKTCNMEIELRSLEVEHFDGGFIQSVSEARFDGYSLAIFGESPDLLRAIMDAFVRINCDQ